MLSYSTFIFDSYSWDPETGTVQLRYGLDDEIRFTEKLIFPVHFPFAQHIDEAEFNRALFALHLIGGISYYKTCLPKKIEIRSGKLNEEQAAFWNSVYENGLGEFFYKNKIDFEGLIDFPHEKVPNPNPNPNPNPSAHVLVPIGGGKDSIVTLEQLKKAGKSVTLFRLGHHPLITKIAEAAQLPLLTVERHLSPELFKLNEEGALNGHIPITAYLSCVTVLASLVYGFDEVAMSNEKSANVGNVEYRGKMINHQWSKSEEFETMFQAYVKNFISGRVRYFSQLRPMTELEIVGEFVKHPQYFGCTTSCNTNWRIVKERPKELWCGKCPKCAFVFALYAAYLPKQKLIEIFGKNLFDDAALLPLYKELLGLEGFKPFECVGTPEETKEAFTMARARGDLNDTTVMKMFTDL